jgi:hypothetical protein
MRSTVCIYSCHTPRRVQLSVLASVIRAHLRSYPSDGRRAFLNPPSCCVCRKMSARTSKGREAARTSAFLCFFAAKTSRSSTAMRSTSACITAAFGMMRCTRREGKRRFQHVIQRLLIPGHLPSPHTLVGQRSAQIAYRNTAPRRRYSKSLIERACLVTARTMATSPPPPPSTVTLSVWTDLPPELFPLIFEELEDKTIRSCALVRRQWRWPAQRRLFRRVVVYPHKQYLRDGVVYTHKQFLRLTETLCASLHLRPFVKILGLEITSPDAETIVRADGLFPAVEELRVRGQNLTITAYLPQLRILKKWEERNAEDPQVPSARLPIALERIKFLNRGELLPEWFTLWVARGTETLAAQSLKELRIHSRRPADGSIPAYMQAFLRAHAHLDRLELAIMDPTDQGRPGASLIMLVLPDA